ncbi:transcription factor bHLH95 [Rosa chinensis]|uniref:transcription factor bHLH95 n=1 Tax=Rosa chinensis TaxID=74649 RepID=UPI001AD8DBF6|nr:transcription factor bHLH95 [Rosa chinensis]
MEKEVNESRKGQKAGGGAWVERERRKKMKDMFSSLHALLPQLPAKADHCTIVDEAVRYIKSLEHTLQTAQKQRLTKLRSSASTSITSKTEARSDAGVTRKAFLADHFQEEEDRPSKKLACGNNPSPTSLDSQQASCFKTWFSPNIVVNICGNEAHVSVCSPRRPGLLSTVFYILEKHKLDVISAHISSDQHRCMYMIHAHYAGGACDDTLPAGALSVEDTFNLAAGELNLCLFSS